MMTILVVNPISVMVLLVVLTPVSLFITDFKFSQAFTTQVESKVVAFQKYLTEQNNLKAIQVVANQTVVQAQASARANVAKANGESQAIKIITVQLKESDVSSVAIN
jgi:hypothetical protein